MLAIQSAEGTQMVMTHALPALEEPITQGVVGKMTPEQIRETVAVLVQQNKMEIANALSEAALALHPQNEEVLVIASLLAESQADWAKAEALLVQVAQIQGNAVTPQTWLHLAKVLRCQDKNEDAATVLDFAAEKYPDNAAIKAECESFMAFVISQAEQSEQAIAA